MRSRVVPILLTALVAAAAHAAPATRSGHTDARAAKPSVVPRLVVTPTSFRLADPDARQQLVVTQKAADGRLLERTGSAKFVSLDPKVAQVSASGLVTPVRDGVARIRARWNAGVTDAVVSVEVRNARPPSFTRDIQPLLTAAGCNGGTCHGKAEGQAGFRLSLFGYDPEFDYETIVKASGGRRVARLDAARSLLLLKATSQVPHGGGLRLRPGSRPYRLLTRWIASAAPYRGDGEPGLTGITVYPPERSLGLNASQRLIVTARYADGSTRDVTHEAKYTSNNPAILNVDEEGRATSRDLPGAAAVMASYQGLLATSRILVPRSATGPTPALPPADSYIDRLVWSRLAKLRIQPSEPATDEEFLRRAYLDLIGTLPTVAETRAFLAECEAERKAGAENRAKGGRGQGAGGLGGQGRYGLAGRRGAKVLGARGKGALLTAATSESRGSGYALRNTHYSAAANPPPALKTRAKLVDELLRRPEYADFWALKWADVLRVDKRKLGAKGAHGFYQWLRSAVAENLPYHQFVREIVTASGSSAENGAVNLFRVLEKPEETASSLSQVFLGVRIECAQCHHHPFEKWSQDDYYGMVGFFTRLKKKADGPHSILLAAGGNGEAKHPRTGETVPPHPLEEKPEDLSSLPDRRLRLADWMAHPSNRFVPRMLVNRIWAHFLGRGIVEPVDDFRDTNPPSNPELLDALTKDFVQGGYDVQRLIRRIMNSQVYQLSSRSNPTNAGDEQSFSRAYPKRLMAEVMMDAVASVTGVPPDLGGLPAGTRAIQVWDSEWSTQWQSYFLNIFGRPARSHPCECERSQEPSIVQVLHLMNSPEIQQQIADRRGRARALARSDRTPGQIVEELFLAAYARRPTAAEEAQALLTFERAGGDRIRATEDVLWALMNTMEFVFNH